MNNTAFNRDKGLLGERIAVDYLHKKGFKILKQNYSPKTNFQGGEIDIIAKFGDIIHFIEVKMRNTNRFGFGREAVTPLKQKIIRRIATRYLVENGIYENANVCFDVIEINGTFANSLIEFFENCF